VIAVHCGCCVFLVSARARKSCGIFLGVKLEKAV
jgi:hypothetical protein